MSKGSHDVSPASPSSGGWRRWFQFSLRGLFLGMVVLATGLGWLSDHQRMEERLVSERENTAQERAEADALRGAQAVVEAVDLLGRINLSGSYHYGGINATPAELDEANVEHFVEHLATEPRSPMVYDLGSGLGWGGSTGWAPLLGSGRSSSFSGSTILITPTMSVPNPQSRQSVQDVAPQPASVAALLKLLHDGDAAKRARAACTLARLGPDAQPAVPALIGAVKDADAAVQYHAVYALGRSRRNAPDVLSALRQVMAADPPTNAAFAAQMLHRLDPSSDVAPRLIELLSVRDAAVRRQAVRALLAVCQSPTPSGNQPPAADMSSAMPALKQLFTDEDKELAKLAMSAVAHIAPPAEAHAALREVIRARATVDVELWNFAGQLWYRLDRVVGLLPRTPTTPTTPGP